MLYLDAALLQESNGGSIGIAVREQHLQLCATGLLLARLDRLSLFEDSNRCVEEGDVDIRL